VVPDDEHAVRHGHDGLLFAALAGYALELRRQVVP
jgi:hypothetical protein